MPFVVVYVSLWGAWCCWTWWIKKRKKKRWISHDCADPWCFKKIKISGPKKKKKSILKLDKQYSNNGKKCQIIIVSKFDSCVYFVNIFYEASSQIIWYLCEWKVAEAALFTFHPDISIKYHRNSPNCRGGWQKLITELMGKLTAPWWSYFRKTRRHKAAGTWMIHGKNTR